MGRVFHLEFQTALCLKKNSTEQRQAKKTLFETVTTEIELMSTETKDGMIFKIWGELVQKY